MTTTLLMIFIVVTALAVVVQMIVIIALALAVRRTSTKVEELTESWHNNAVPLLQSTQKLLTESAPKISTVLDNTVHTTPKIKGQVDRIDAEFDGVLQRAKAQIIRTEDMIGRTLNRVEDAAVILERGVMTPARRAQGVLHGLSAGLGVLFGRRRAGDGTPGAPKDDMFI